MASDFNPRKLVYRTLLPLALLLLSLLLPVVTVGLVSMATAAESHTEFNLDQDMGRRGNILDLIFGTPPPIATERGLLLIDAFHDRNGNERRDPGEEDLDREIFCLVDGIEYDVPAFIPGLTFRGSYRMLCAGERFVPSLKKTDLFVEQRGQILRLDIPCRKSLLSPAPPLP